MKSGRYKGCIDVWNFVCSFVPPLPRFDALYELPRKKPRYLSEKRKKNSTSELALSTREIARSNDAKLCLRWKAVANRSNNPLYSFNEVSKGNIKRKKHFNDINEDYSISKVSMHNFSNFDEDEIQEKKM